MEKISSTLTAGGIDAEVAKFCEWVGEQAIMNIAESGSLPIISFIKMNPKGENAKMTGGDVLIHMAPPVNSDLSKDIYMELTRYIAYREQSSSVVLTSEVWMPPANTDEKKFKELIEKYGSVSNMPGKQEAIMLTLAHNATGNKKPVQDEDIVYAMIMYLMDRDKQDNIVNIRVDKVEVMNKDASLKGRMSEMFYFKEDMEHPKFEMRLMMNAMMLNNVKIMVAKTNGFATGMKFN